MGKSKKSNIVSKEDDKSEEEGFLCGTILRLGSILVILIGVLASQLEDIITTVGVLNTGGKAQDEIRLSRNADGRGVAGIILHEDMDVAATITPFVDRNEAFVCRGCIPQTRLRFWSNDAAMLEIVGPDAEIPVRVAKRSSSSTASSSGTLFRRLITPGTSKSAYDERIMQISEFLAAYDNKTSEDHLYGAQIPIVTHLPQLIDQIRASAPLGTLVEALGPTPPVNHKPLSMYIGYGPLKTQTHYDSLENFVCVMSGGMKTFELYDPATASLYMYINRREQGNGASVFDNTGSKDRRQSFPLSKYAIPTRVSLSPGDCLYLPVYWYHSVESSEHRTISINWWRMPDRSKMIDLEHIFCGHSEESASAARATCH